MGNSKECIVVDLERYMLLKGLEEECRKYSSEAEYTPSGDFDGLTNRFLETVDDILLKLEDAQ